MAWPIWLAKLKTPSRTATTRSRRCLVSQRRPSLIWVRTVSLVLVFFWDLGRVATSAAEPRAEERLPHRQADLLAAVGLRQEFGRHQGGEDRLGGVAEDDLGAAKA